MDTDDLTPMAYQSILIADRITDDLAVNLGVISRDYSKEDDYLEGILEFVMEIQSYPVEYLDSWDLVDVLELERFRASIENLIAHIRRTIQTSMNQRGTPPGF